MTTRGIINGSDCYPIRTVRDKSFRLIWNLSWETEFTNACTRHETFRSMLKTAREGDERAQRVTHDYQHRPEWELYDVNSDPLEQSNLYGKPAHADAANRLKQQLRDWMADQGDKGIQTEMEAKDHQGRRRQRKRSNGV